MHGRVRGFLTFFLPCQLTMTKMQPLTGRRLFVAGTTAGTCNSRIPSKSIEKAMITPMM